MIRGCAPATLRYYTTKVLHLMRLLGPQTLIADIDAKMVDEMVAARINEGASRSTVSKEFRALGSVLRMMRRRGQWSGDVDAVLPDGWSTDAKTGGETHTLEQARALVEALQPSRAGHVAFLFVTGARLGPSFAAERDDIDLVESLIRIRGTKTKRAARVVPVFGHVADLAARARLAAHPTGPAYPSWGNVRRDMAAACRRAGVPVLGPNGCRRSAATWLVEQGAPTGIVSFFLGHTTSRLVEQVYGRLDGEKLAKGFESVGIKIATGSGPS